MSDSTPPAGGPAKPTEKKDTVRITLPPRPVQGAPAAQATPASGTAVRPGATVPAMPIAGKKETSRLKKTTGKVPGATKPAMPVVPPPTLKAQPIAPRPVSTVSAAPVSPQSTIVAAPANTTVAARPTVKLQTAEIPKMQSAASVPAAPPAAAPAAAPSGPGMIDLVLSVLVLAVSGVAAYLIFNLYNQTNL